MFARSRTQLRLLLFMVVAVAALAVPGLAVAATATWEGDVDTDWTVAGNWSTNALPVAADDVIIPGETLAGGDVTIVNVPDVTVASFTVEDAGLAAQNNQVMSSGTVSTVTVTGALGIVGGTFNTIGFNLTGTAPAVIDDGVDYTAIFDGANAPFGASTIVGAGRVLTLAGNSSSLNFNNLIVANGGLVRVTGSPTIAATTSILNGDAVVVDDNATLSFQTGAISGGTSTKVNGTVDGFVNLNGMLLSNVRFGGVSMNVVGAASSTTTGSTVAFGGQVALDTNLRLGEGSTLHIEPTSYVGVSVDGVAIGFQGIGASTATILNEGGLTFEAVNAVTAGSGLLEADLTNSGVNSGLSILGTYTVDTDGHDITSSQGDISLEDGSPTLIAGTVTSSDSTGTNSAFIGGTGTIQGATIVDAGGVVVPDRAAGPSLTFTDLTMNTGSRLEIYLDSATVYGQIEAAGVTDGEITISPSGGYVPAVGTTFAVRVPNGAGAVDTFAQVDSRQLGNGLWMAQSIVANQVTLTTRLATIAASTGGFPGGSVTLVGTGFAPGELVSIDVFGDVEGYASAQSTASASGGFSVVVPMSASFKPGGFNAFAYGAVSKANVIGSGTLVAAPVATTTTTGMTGTTTAGNDTFVGTGGNDTASGGAGNDTFAGNAGNDGFTGDDGNDVFDGGAGADTFFGGEGDDSGFGGLGDDLLYGGLGTDRLVGGDGTDKLYGNEGGDKLFGSTGGDVLYGGPGNDILRGGTGADRIYCGTGIDIAMGDNGMDLIGCRDGQGGDTISGGPGLDVCVGDRGDRFLSCETIFRLA